MKKVVLSTIAGSKMYGTNIETSDTDIRGFYIEDNSALFGLGNDDIVEYKDNDTVLYGLKKGIRLLANQTPDVLVLLGAPEDCILELSGAGELLLENRHLFITKNIFYTFGGYAKGLIDSMRVELAENKKEESSHKVTEEYITHKVNSILGYSLIDGIRITDKGKAIVNLNRCSIQLGELQNTIDYIKPAIGRVSDGGRSRRNRKTSPQKLAKHMMHLVRVYNTAIDAFKYGEIVSRRPEAEFLLGIRDGLYLTEDNKVLDEFFDLANNLEKDLRSLFEKSKLPERSDITAINWLMYEMYRSELKCL